MLWTRGGRRALGLAGRGTPTLRAIGLMRERKVGCLPVVENDKLVGIVTESDFIDVSAKLLDEWLQD